jgi:AraC-like DNA-binding protein
MGNRLLLSLLTGVLPQEQDAGAAVMFSRLYMAGFCVLSFQADQRTSADKFPGGKTLEDRFVSVIDSFNDSRSTCAACIDEAGRMLVLMTFAARRDYDESEIRLRCDRIRQELSDLAAVPVIGGAGGFVICYEMIPFSCQEALFDMYRNRAGRTVRQILRYVEEHYGEPKLNIRDISDSTFMNYSYLCTAFHREMGITLNRYIRIFRMRRALDEMWNAGVTIQQAALKAGYDDPKYFIKSFKRELVLTPGLYLKRVSHLP